MLEYIDKGYVIMFFFGFLIDKINLFPFFLGILLGLFVSTNNSTIQYLYLFNQSYQFIKTNLDSIIPKDTNIEKTNIEKTNIVDETNIEKNNIVDETTDINLETNSIDNKSPL